MVEALGGLRHARERLAGVDVIAATDVEHPLLGPMGAARVFGPQKGADDETVDLLERRLTAWADDLDAAAGHRVRDLRGAGAAGGLGAALFALGARRESGAAVIAAHTGLDADLAAADLVITGEGRFDDQSLHGKVVSALAAGAAAGGNRWWFWRGRSHSTTPRCTPRAYRRPFRWSITPVRCGWPLVMRRTSWKGWRGGRHLKWGNRARARYR